MKPQDVLFFLIIALLFYRRDYRLFVLLGIISLILAIPLFSLWIFFTAERLTWYAASFFLIAILLYIWKDK